MARSMESQALTLDNYLSAQGVGMGVGTLLERVKTWGRDNRIRATSGHALRKGKAAPAGKTARAKGAKAELQKRRNRRKEAEKTVTQTQRESPVSVD